MKLNKKGLPVALLNRVAFWAVVLGCFAALIVSIGSNSGPRYVTELFSFVSVGVSIGAVLGGLQYLAYKRKTK